MQKNVIHLRQFFLYVTKPRMTTKLETLIHGSEEGKILGQAKLKSITWKSNALIFKLLNSLEEH